MKTPTFVLLTMVIAMLSIFSVRASAAPMQVHFDVGIIDSEETLGLLFRLVLHWK